MMPYLLGGLLLGGVLGYCLKSADKPLKWAGIVQKAGVYLLIFSMGMGLGQDALLFDNLPVLGGQALVVALVATLLSGACSWLLAGLLRTEP